MKWKLPRGFTSACTPVVVYTMIGEHLARILGIAAMVPKSDGVAKLLGRIQALLEAEDALAMQGADSESLQGPSELFSRLS
jgi:hypothetical protein